MFRETKEDALHKVSTLTREEIQSLDGYMIDKIMETVTNLKKEGYVVNINSIHGHVVINISIIHPIKNIVGKVLFKDNFIQMSVLDKNELTSTRMAMSDYLCDINDRIKQLLKGL